MGIQFLTEERFFELSADGCKKALRQLVGERMRMPPRAGPNGIVSTLSCACSIQCTHCTACGACIEQFNRGVSRAMEPTTEIKIKRTYSVSEWNACSLAVASTAPSAQYCFYRTPVWFSGCFGPRTCQGSIISLSNKLLDLSLEVDRYEENLEDLEELYCTRVPRVRDSSASSFFGS